MFINVHANNEEELRTVLTGVIFEYRLYTDLQLKALFEQAQEQNSTVEGMTMDKIEAVCQAVKQEFDQTE